MIRRLSFVLLVLWFGGAAAYSDTAEYRIARLSYIDGHVSLQHSGDVDWSAASVNMPLQPADRVYTGADGRAEIEFDDGSILRLAEKTDVEILSTRDDLVQLRLLVGLSTLTVQSGLDFEINTPAAAFNTVKKGVYRFDVADNGDSDGIVRKGELEGASNSFTRRAEAGELIHATPGEQGTNVLSRYDGRDEWDEWNDRRNAELTPLQSRRYIPDQVYSGVRDLDVYGRWVDVEYGAAWVPSQVAADWSPYWEGRWVYRPLWGWTWVSYEPWGWLPYHYGRWYRHSNFGWCWLPGASFGFNFWSPGLVRFYNGPSWVSWVPLGPGDYYNVNNFYYRGNYGYQLNNLRLAQRRSPDDLFNRHIPGAFRTVRTDQFLNDSFGARSRIAPVSGADEPWRGGRMVTDRLSLQPGARSFAAAPDRQAVRPASSEVRAVVVRSEPSVRPSGPDRFLRITTPNAANPAGSRYDGRNAAGAGVADPSGGSRIYSVPGNSREGAGTGGSSIWNRRTPDNPQPAPGAQPTQTAPQNPRTQGYRPYGRDQAGEGSSGVRRMESPSPRNATDGVIDRGRRDTSPGSTIRPDATPRRMESAPAASPRIDRTPSPGLERRQPERPRQESRASDPGGHSFGYAPRTYTAPQYRSLDAGAGSSTQRFSDADRWQNMGAPADRATPAPQYRSFDGGAGSGVQRFPQAGRWQDSGAPAARYTPAPAPQSAPSWGRGGGYTPRGNITAPPARAPSAGFGGSGMRGGSPGFGSSPNRGQSGMGHRRDR